MRLGTCAALLCATVIIGCGPPPVTGATGDAGDALADAGADASGPGGVDAVVPGDGGRGAGDGAGDDAGGGGGGADGGTGPDAADGGGDAAGGPDDCGERLPGLERKLLVTGLDEIQVVDMAFDPSGRALVVQKNGTIRVVRDGALLEAPFTTVPDTSDAWIETGLLGIAFDPDFPASPWVYLFQSYVTTPGEPAQPGECDKLDCPFALETAPDGTTTVVNAPGGPSVFGNTRQRVIRYDASADTVEAGAFQVLIDGLPGGTQTHNGGGLAFGLDKRLFVGLGDATTPPNAQDFSNVAGCILRIERDGGVPPDNPFVAADDGIPDVIWACGVRQGFGLAVHPDTGELYQSENGPSFGDELNWIPKGGNLGWNVGAGKLGLPGITDPVVSWTPTIAPVKLVVYAGGLMPSLRGDVLLASWGDGDLRRIHLKDAAGAPGLLGWEGDVLPYVGKPVLVAQDPAGFVYVGEHLSGEIWRIQPVDACDAPQAVASAVPASGDAPLTVTLSAAASSWSPPATKIVKRHWELGPHDGHPEGAEVTHTFEHPGTITGMLTVVDDLGRHGQTLFTVVVGEPAGWLPAAHIASVKPTTGQAPLEVEFVGHGHGALVESSWSFGDGSDDLAVPDPKDGVNAEVVHVFEQAGEYTVTFAVKDDAGKTAIDTVVISVE